MPEEPMDAFLRDTYNKFRPCIERHGFSEVEVDNEGNRVIFRSKNGGFIMHRRPGRSEIRLYGVGSAVEHAKKLGYSGQLEKTALTVEISGIGMTAHEFDGKSLLEKLLPEEKKPSGSHVVTNSEEMGDFPINPCPGN